MSKQYVCEKCGSLELFIKESGSQTGLYCSECGKWIKWLPKNEIELAKRFIENNKDIADKTNIDIKKIKELIKEGYKEFEKVRKNISPLAVAFQLRDILEDIEKELDK